MSGIALPTLAPMAAGDLDEIMLIERRAFVDPWSRRTYLTDLAQNSLATYLVLRSTHLAQPAILAYGGFWLLADDAHIATIASHPAWRGCGLGQWLLVGLLDAAVARQATHATLEVRSSNLVAQRLYEKLGFQPVGARKRYYRDGEDGVIMTTPPLASPEMQTRIETARRDAHLRVSRCLADTGAVLGANAGASEPA